MAVWGLMRGRLRDYGLSTRGMSRHVWIYVALFAAILPIVIVASYTKPFVATYPFYKYAGRSWTDFIAWELMYAASFVALEFFFRGFLLFALERQMGAYAIFVMVVPYCMIHFNKPVAEVCGAIFAGVVLGTLAMATRSIWCGVLIHISVAWTMDCLALLHTTGLPGSGRFIGEYDSLKKRWAPTVANAETNAGAHHRTRARAQATSPGRRSGESTTSPTTTSTWSRRRP